MPKPGLQGTAKGRTDLYRMDPTDLHIKDGWNSREASDPANVEHVEMLARSIAEVGVKSPLTVYWEDDRAYVSDGHSRLAAVRLAISRGADIKDIPVQPENRYASEAERVLSQIVRNSGKPLTPFEQAKVFKRLVDFGWSEADIASKIGLSRQHVVDLLNLQAAPASVTDFVRSGEVSATLASQTLKAHRGDVVKASKALTEGVTRAKTEGKSRATAKYVLPRKAMFASAEPDLRPGLDAAIEIVKQHYASWGDPDVGRIVAELEALKNGFGS